MLINAEGIVLRQRKIANNRRMIVIFTKQYGKISAGTSLNERSRSRSALALRPFTYSEYDIFKGRETYSINTASVLRSYYSIGEDLDRFAVASVFIEYLDRVLQEGEPMPGLFDLSLKFLETISSCSGSGETLLYAFIMRSLRMLGVMPEIGCCVGCGKAADRFGTRTPAFSVTSGGIICEECVSLEKREGNALIYSPTFDIIQVFRFFISKPIETFGKVSLKADVVHEIRTIIAEYISRYLGVDVLRERAGQAEQFYL